MRPFELGAIMPIYAYRCTSCGFKNDVLRKLSDAPLTTCPACGAETFSKQLTAAGFHLKGSGWYATDFKGGNKPAAESKAEATTENKTETKSETAASAPATPAAAPVPTKTVPAPT